MSAPDAEVVTRTTVTTPNDDADHDGVISDPSRGMANLLWAIKQFVLGIGIVWVLGILGLLAFTPDSPKGVVDAATLVAVLSLLVQAFMAGFARRQN